MNQSELITPNMTKTNIQPNTVPDRQATTNPRLPLLAHNACDMSWAAHLGACLAACVLFLFLTRQLHLYVCAGTMGSTCSALEAGRMDAPRYGEFGLGLPLSMLPLLLYGRRACGPVAARSQRAKQGACDILVFAAQCSGGVVAGFAMSWVL